MGKSGAETAAAEGPATLYRDCAIVPTPRKEGNQWRLAGIIRKEVGGAVRERVFVRSDLFSDKETAAQFAVQKGQLIIDQRRDLFDDPNDTSPV